jgi:hypothetical protein
LAVAVIAYGCKWVLDRVKLYAGQYDHLASLSLKKALPHVHITVRKRIGTSESVIDLP